MVQNSFSCPRLDAPLTGTRLLYAHLQFRLQKMSNTGKLFYKNLFIRYNLKIRYNEIYTYLFFLVSKFEPIKINITGFISFSVQVVVHMVQLPVLLLFPYKY